MFLTQLLSLTPEGIPDTNNLPAWLAAALAAMAAGTLTRKQRRKLRWRLAWEMTKTRMGFGKRAKEKGKTGLIILMAVLLAVCFGAAILVGLLKEFLILVGVFVLFFILFAGAFKRQHGHY